MAADLPFDLEDRNTHLNAQGLPLSGSGDHTAMVIREDDDQPAVEMRSEDPLTARAEAIAIDQGHHVHAVCSLGGESHGQPRPRFRHRCPAE